MKNALLKNTIYLYLLTFSNYLFAFITIPYQTRILGPEIFGILGVAIAFQTYFNLILDFGFILSGTKLVAKAASDKKELSQILSAITYAKISIFIILSLTLYVLCNSIDYLNTNKTILFLYLILAALTSIIPDFLYRGLENMKMITYRTLIVRFLFTCLIFIFLKKPEQYYIIPISQIIGTLVALIWIFYDITQNLKLKFTTIDTNYLITITKKSSQYFLSRIASSVYNVTNTVILGFIYPNSNIVGLYTSTEKIRSIVAQACSPIADSFYPYMLRTSNYKKLFKTTAILEFLILIFCIILWIYAESICVIAFGDKFIEAGIILRYITPLIAIILPTFMFGFPALSPLGMDKWANYAIEIAMINQIIGLLVLYFTNSITIYNICIVTLISELICLVIRITTLFICLKKQHHEKYNK